MTEAVTGIDIVKAQIHILDGFATPGGRAKLAQRQAYIFGAVCPRKGNGAGLVLPCCDTEAMQEHLAEIGRSVDDGAQAVLILGQAGWHVTPKLKVPDNITLMFLPPRSPELNPVENVWQFMRDNWLSNRIFKDYDDIVTHCCAAWNKLLDEPWKIMSIGLREWAHRSSSPLVDMYK